MQTAEISLETRGSQVFDLTAQAAAFCRPLGDGLLSVFAPHATAGVALMELGSGSEPDLAEVLERLLPRDDRYRHRHGSRGHGADHLPPVFVCPSLWIPVVGGRLGVCTWQGLGLVDLNPDNPLRRVRLSFVSGPLVESGP